MPKRKLEILTSHKTDARKPPGTQAISQPIAPKKSSTTAENTNTEAQPPENNQANADVHAHRIHKRPPPRSKGPVDVSQELSSLKYPSRQNKQLPKLPANTTISKRPINHGPIASRFAGSSVPKVVYVSRRTPVISAVKRVKQFLREIEKRALQSAGLDGILNRGTVGSGRGGGDADGNLQRKLGELSEKLGREGEEVLVKASGRAIEQALRVGEWFRNREEEMLCKVEVKTGSVSVVDDIVEVDVGDEVLEGQEGDEGNENERDGQEIMAIEGGDTTMELLGNLESNGKDSEARENQTEAGDLKVLNEDGQKTIKAKRKRKRKKQYDPNDIPEARLRWIKTVEVAISLRA